MWPCARLYFSNVVKFANRSIMFDKLFTWMNSLVSRFESTMSTLLEWRYVRLSFLFMPCHFRMWAIIACHRFLFFILWKLPWLLGKIVEWIPVIFTTVSILLLAWLIPSCLTHSWGKVGEEMNSSLSQENEYNAGLELEIGSSMLFSAPITVTLPAHSELEVRSNQ